MRAQHKRDAVVPDIQVVRYERDGDRSLTLQHRTLRDRPLAADVTARWLAEQTQGFSGAEIEGVCHRAMMTTLSSRIEASPDQPDTTGVEIQKKHLQTAIEELSPRMARVEHE